MTTVSWFSAGVSSAVATKLALDSIDEIIYTHIDDQHPDSLRFLHDCEKWFDRTITLLQSPLKSVDAVIKKSKYINGPSGAPCTRLLKREIRKEWEYGKKNLTYVWGIDISELKRCSGLIKAMPDMTHRFPLIEQHITKEQAHQIIRIAGIARPTMYELGFNNNNCIGCVKGGKGYWNLIRKHFPEVFASRALLEREIGASCINGMYLDELPLNCGNAPTRIDDDCGFFCEAKL